MRIFKIIFTHWNHPGLIWMSMLPLFLTLSAERNSVSYPAQTSANDSTFTTYSTELANSDQTIEMVPVPGGTFAMGPFENGDLHKVKVDSFWIGKYEITWNEYNIFRNEILEDIRTQVYKELYGVDLEGDVVSSPSLSEEALNLLRENDIPADIISLPSPPYSDMSAGMGTDGFPAVSMTHYAAFMFTKWLTVKTGEFYRLPTEAEWEYACRAANPGEYTAMDAGEVDHYAWHRDNSNRQYQKPGSKEPNALGIHDMLGNVAEWTFDQFHEDYMSLLEGQPADNPFFKPTQLYPRTARGGSWMDPSVSASCLKRRPSNPNWKIRDPQLPKSMWWHTNAPFIGFRVVKPVDQPSTVDEMEKYWIEAMQDYN